MAPSRFQRWCEHGSRCRGGSKAARHGVSRKFVYQQTHKARAALDGAFASAAASDDEVLFELAVTKAWLRQVIVGLALICRGSYRGVAKFLRQAVEIAPPRAQPLRARDLPLRRMIQDHPGWTNKRRSAAHATTGRAIGSRTHNVPHWAFVPIETLSCGTLSLGHLPDRRLGGAQQGKRDHENQIHGRGSSGGAFSIDGRRFRARRPAAAH